MTLANIDTIAIFCRYKKLEESTDINLDLHIRSRRNAIIELSSSIQDKTSSAFPLKLLLGCQSVLRRLWRAINAVLRTDFPRNLRKSGGFDLFPLCLNWFSYYMSPVTLRALRRSLATFTLLISSPAGGI